MTCKPGLFAILIFLFVSCSTSRKSSKPVDIPTEPSVMKEFRAAWVATVANINWPSKPGLTTEEQQNEAIALLDFLKENHFNAVIFQVRPQADALYQSSLEPWSYYLTGVQGRAPDPFYDPLAFWVEKAHERGLELHVWLNPYRAHHISGGPVTDSSIVIRKPELVVSLKEGYWWFDPSLKGTQDHSTAVVMDIVKRYDIDGVHFDDYFYPYPSYNKNEDFPDSTSWTNYLANGGNLTRSDWRRDAVNDFIKNLYKKIKKEKPYVKFGLSPFGIWRPGYPESICCFDQYDVLYADARLWLNKGWIDYFSPQLYWPINRMQQSFPLLLGWWDDENTKKRHLWPGISVGRDTSLKNVNEILSQVMISRGILPESKGVIHWSISSLTSNPQMTKALMDGPYKKQAIVPPSSWLDRKAPQVPQLNKSEQGDSLNLTWSHKKEDDVFQWILYSKYDKGSWNYRIFTRNEKNISIPATIISGSDSLKLKEVRLSAVDRTGNESKAQIIYFN